MASPYTISVIADVLQNSVESILRDQRGATLPEDSMIKGYANRETTEITYNVLIGGEDVVSDGVAAIQPTVGNGPIIPDDLLFNTFGRAGQEILIRARNSAAAAAREARVTIFVIPIDDFALQRAMDALA